MSASIPVSVDLTFAGEGGNTHDGQYFYSFTPPIVRVTDPDTLIVYQLSGETGDEYKIIDLFASVSMDNIKHKVVEPDGRSISVVDSNTLHQLILVSLLIHDLKRDVRFSCDPQITNTPKI